MSSIDIYEHGYIAVAGVPPGGKAKVKISPSSLIERVVGRGTNLKRQTINGYVSGLEWKLGDMRITLAIQPTRFSLLPEYHLETPSGDSPDSEDYVEIVSGFDPVYGSDFIILLGEDQHLYYRTQPSWSRDEQWNAWSEFQRLQMPKLAEYSPRSLQLSNIDSIINGRVVYMLSDLVEGERCYLFAHPTGYYLITDDYAERIPPPDDPSLNQPLLPMVLVVSLVGDRMLLANDCYLFGETISLNNDYSERHQDLVDAVYNSQAYLFAAGWELRFQTQSPFDSFERLAEVVKEHTHRRFPYDVVGFVIRPDSPVGQYPTYIHMFTEWKESNSVWLLSDTSLSTPELAGEPHRLLQRAFTDVMNIPEGSKVYDEPENVDEVEGTVRLITVHGGLWLNRLRSRLQPGQQVQLLTLNADTLDSSKFEQIKYGPYHLQKSGGKWLMDETVIHPVDPYNVPGYKVVQWKPTIPVRFAPQVASLFARFWCMLVLERE